MVILTSSLRLARPKSSLAPRLCRMHRVSKFQANRAIARKPVPVLSFQLIARLKNGQEHDEFVGIATRCRDTGYVAPMNPLIQACWTNQGKISTRSAVGASVTPRIFASPVMLAAALA